MRFGFAAALLLAFAGVFADDITLTSGLGKRTGGGRRSVIHTDPVEYDIVTGKWKSPKAGADGWAAVTANDKGVFDGGPAAGGYIDFTVTVDEPKIMLLTAKGHSLVYVNGEPHTGDPYGFGYLTVPVQLKQGKNDLLFLCGRGSLEAKLTEPTERAYISLADATLPDILTNDRGSELLAGIVVVNASNDWLNAWNIESSGGAAGDMHTSTELGSVAPLSIRKFPVWIVQTPDGKSKLQLQQANRLPVGNPLDLSLRVREPRQTFKATFLSDIDGSLQYYAVNPPYKDSPNPALFLSVHGASVEAIGQADAYGAKDWGYLVAPTNRRPYGFDWEDVGRLDAMEVLKTAQKRFQTDPQKTYLTGHSMGGHGTWQLGAIYPDQFAAIAPCSGWESFASYVGGDGLTDSSPMESMLKRANNSSSTLLMKDNYRQEGIFILHGESDQTVPVKEARTMRDELGKFHEDLHYHEEPGQDHWYDTDPEAGANCVDFRGIFDLFSRRRIPTNDEIHELDFTTISPGISSTCHWLKIDQQIHPWMPTQVHFVMDPLRGGIVGKTTNCEFITFDLSQMNGQEKGTVEIDGTKLEVPTASGKASFCRSGDAWAVADSLSPNRKNADRSGGFKDIYRSRVMFVYGTTGTADENAWSFAKARFDAEGFYYRGNSGVGIVADKDVNSRTAPKENLVLYGNADTNSAIKKFVVNSDLAVQKGRADLGGHVFTGGDTAVFMIRPRADVPGACVAVIGGTGLVGMRLTDRVPLFSAGTGIPDYLILGPSYLKDGVKGVKAAGYFDNNWKFTEAEAAFGG